MTALALAASAPAKAGPIQGDTADSTSGLGNFTGSLIYTDSSAIAADLVVTLTNTSPAANGGFLTAFVFNNPSDRITGATLTTSATASNFGLLGDPTFQNGVNGAPFGQFDLGASTSDKFEGGGNPNKGLGVGVTGVFTFHLTGTGLDSLSASSFANALSVGPGIGMGAEFFVARFRGFNDEGSDKVPGATMATPEPSSLVLVGSGTLIGVSFLRRRRPKTA